MPLEPWLEGVYDAERMRDTDRWAIDEQGVPSLDLMEVAGSETAAAAGGIARSRPRLAT